jgi:hydantoinase/carbamoylase family amidase
MPTSDFSNIRINPGRLRADFESLSQFGASASGGVTRPAFSPAHLEMRRWFHEQAQQAGLEASSDGAGNHSARLRCGPAGAKYLLMGSHLDSVPEGGRYDGALGVLAALEVLRTVQEHNLKLPYHLEAIDFTDEEGTLVSFLGSFAFSGLLTAADLEKPRGDPQALAEGLQRAGLTNESILAARRDPTQLTGYLELHVEQGSRMEKAGVQIGAVTHIAGIRFFRLTYTGSPGHGGTIPMEERRDAAWGASAFTLAVRDIVMGGFPECFANVGRVEYRPGFFNIIPQQAELALEFRSPDPEQFERLEQALFENAREQAQRFNLDLDIELIGKRHPARMQPAMVSAVRESAATLGLSCTDIISRAGHDAQAMASICPAGMIFVPSQGGISHSPLEFTPWEDCLNGANVLLQTVLHIAR